MYNIRILTKKTADGIAVQGCRPGLAAFQNMTAAKLRKFNDALGCPTYAKMVEIGLLLAEIRDRAPETNVTLLHRHRRLPFVEAFLPM